MTVAFAQVTPVNALGEIVVQAGTGLTTITGYIPENEVPIDTTTNKMVVKFPGSFVDVVSSAAPNNADGRSDGTLYIQTA